jgi:Sister chromatid cohesion protein Dcc1
MPDDGSLTIKIGPEDDAVLCTTGKTYNIRSVTLSRLKLRSLGVS